MHIILLMPEYFLPGHCQISEKDDSVTNTVRCGGCMAS